ncbi:MAG TPA: TIGR01777 family oxidoreductase [Candidatus Polarisedimenticolia bacterium]|nr:TIGR01777 family oxidoreductase [Candidatus Polarisedimenticolia bacterium]
MNVLIAGGTGYLGSALTRHLVTRGHRVSLLSRRPSAPKATPPVYHWNPERDELDPNALEGAEGVVNLAGESLASGRWTPQRRRRLVASRVGPSAFLVRRWKDTTAAPRVLVNASAVGIYGDRGDEVLTEESAPGEGFLPDLCRAWEEAATGAVGFGARVVCSRFGVVLGPDADAVRKLLPIFRLGLGGPLGSGRQWMSWVSLVDALQAVETALVREDLSGPVNVVAPGAVRNRDFGKALGRVLHRPAFLPAPALALRLVLGPMADEALLTSARAEPARLQAMGFPFVVEDVEAAFRAALGR